MKTQNSNTGLIVGFSVAALVVLPLVCIGVAMSMKWIPDTRIWRGGELSQTARQAIDEAVTLDEGEKILWFYSAAFLDFSADGNLITDRRIVSYFYDGGVQYFAEAYHANVTGIEVHAASGWYEDTIVTIRHDRGEAQFELWLSAEQGLDREVIAFIETIVADARPAPAPATPAALARKKKSEAALGRHAVPLDTSLPVIATVTTLRDADEIAMRTLALYHLVAAGHGKDRGALRASLRRTGVWPHVSPREKTLLQARSLGEEQVVEATWRAEALWTLLWSIGKIDTLDWPADLCDNNRIGDVMVAAMEDPAAFVASVRRRKNGDILDALDLVYRQHSAIGTARAADLDLPVHLHPGVVYERHYALAWIAGHKRHWDDVRPAN